MSAAQRLAAIVIALIVVIGIAVVALNLADGDVAADASPPASASPAASPEPTDAPTDEPSPADDDDVLATLAEIEKQVIAIRGLPAADIGAPELLTRDEFRQELLASFEEDYPPEEVAEDNASLRALGLLEPDQDIAELQLQLLGDQVLGFYDDTDKRMVLVTDEGLDSLAKFTYAHEYTHALQDASFGLASLEIEADGEDDRALSRIALVEGDAVVTMLAWAFANLEPQELAEITSAPQPDTAGIPSWLVEQLVIFPYNEGYLWAGALTGDPLSPDFTELDEAYVDPPDSTEQIIDVEKWEPREAPIPVDGPDLVATFGDGWTEVDDTPIGQAFLEDVLVYHGVAAEEAQAASAGWGGDRVVVATGPGEAFAVAWRLVWDTPADADDFEDAYNSVTSGLGFPASVIRIDDDEVLVAHGSSPDVLRRTIETAGD
jgi:hypothetical protein